MLDGVLEWGLEEVAAASSSQADSPAVLAATTDAQVGS